MYTYKRERRRDKKDEGERGTSWRRKRMEKRDPTQAQWTNIHTHTSTITAHTYTNTLYIRIMLWRNSCVHVLHEFVCS